MVVVAKVTGGVDQETGVFGTYEFPLDKVLSHSAFTRGVPDGAGDNLSEDDYFKMLRQSWDSFRDRLIMVRAESGHEKQRVPSPVKKVCPRVCLPCAIIWS